ncbi:MAG TPA: alpha/beta fold hydrolase [Solirubrobacterales bacterium]|nr:alpha/beta fold hydrolase [Solirubrobacterales bacterium]
MRRGAKIAIGAVVVLIALLAINALIVDSATKNAEATVPGGRILELPGGDVQIVEHGPREADPIVLLHCYTCAGDWWDRITPALARTHRVVAIDLLGHGGSEKPASGYSMPEQAALVATVLRRLGIDRATVVGHSMGGTIAVALSEADPGLVDRVAIVDMPPDTSYGDLGFLAWAAMQPVVGEALWRIKMDSSVRKGLEVAFAPGFDVPDAFVEDVNRMTYTSYDDSIARQDDYLEEEPLDQRMRRTDKPLLVIMGAEEQSVDDPELALAQYARTVPGARTELIEGAGHSPNVEKPAQTARLLRGFIGS